MTDEEKIRYILNWSNKDCRIIAIFHKNEHTTDEITIGDVADIIKSQQAEIERFKQIETTVNGFWSELQKLAMFKDKETPTLEELLEYIENLKAEAIKELANKTNEMITEIYNKHIFGNNDLEAEEKDAIINFSDDVVSGFNNLVKEMAGEQV